jgi:hypothetical protein
MEELSAIELSPRFDLDRLPEYKFSVSMQDLALTNADITKRIPVKPKRNFVTMALLMCGQLSESDISLI